MFEDIESNPLSRTALKMALLFPETFSNDFESEYWRSKVPDSLLDEDGNVILEEDTE